MADQESLDRLYGNQEYNDAVDVASHRIVRAMKQASKKLTMEYGFSRLFTFTDLEFVIREVLGEDLVDEEG